MTTHGYHDSKDSHLKRLRRIEGQIRGLQRMVEDDKYCIDILTQVSAATKALQSFSLELLDEHLEHCVVDAARRAAPRPTRRSARPPRRSPGWSAADRPDSGTPIRRALRSASTRVRDDRPMTDVTTVPAPLPLHWQTLDRRHRGSGREARRAAVRRSRRRRLAGPAAPGWDGDVHGVTGIADAGAVRSSGACPYHAAWGQQFVDDGGSLDELRAALPERMGVPTHVVYRGVCRWAVDVPPASVLPDAGEWLPAADPRVPDWLKPFGGDVLVVLDDDVYVAGVGLKHHDQHGEEISVGTEEAARGRAWPGDWSRRRPGPCSRGGSCRRTCTTPPTSPPRRSPTLRASRTAAGRCSVCSARSAPAASRPAACAGSRSSPPVLRTEAGSPSGRWHAP